MVIARRKVYHALKQSRVLVDQQLCLRGVGLRPCPAPWLKLLPQEEVEGIGHALDLFDAITGHRATVNDDAIGGTRLNDIIDEFIIELVIGANKLT